MAPAMALRRNKKIFLLGLAWVALSVLFLHYWLIPTSSSNIYLDVQPRDGGSPDHDLAVNQQANRQHRTTTIKPFLRTTTSKLDAIRKHFLGLGRPNITVNVTEEDVFCRQSRFLVHVCTRSASSMCGGYGDRQRGIVTSYLLALLLGREFAVMHNKPCPLTDFLDYTTYNWFRCNKYFMPVSVHNHVDDRSFKKRIPEFDFDKEYKNRVEYILTNRNWENELLSRPEAVARLKEFQNKSHSTISNKVLNRLFRPKAELGKELVKFFTNYQFSRKLVCTHIRVYENNLQRDVEQFANVNEGLYIQTITNFLRNYTNSETYNIFVASNSDKVKSYVRKKLDHDIVTFSESITNVDGTSSCSELRLVLLEQYILSQCDVLIITFSGLGMASAYIRGSDEELYCPYGPNKEVHRCSFEDIYREYEMYK